MAGTAFQSVARAPRRQWGSKSFPVWGFLWGDDRVLEMAKGHSYIIPNKLYVPEFKMVHVGLRGCHFSK